MFFSLRLLESVEEPGSIVDSSSSRLAILGIWSAASCPHNGPCLELLVLLFGCVACTLEAVPSSLSSLEAFVYKFVKNQQ